MESAVINIKTPPKIKIQAQKVARELGFNLSVLINGYLRQLIKTKTVHFSHAEEPNEFLIESIRQARADIKKGKTISFKTGDAALKYIDKLIAHEQKSL